MGLKSTRIIIPHNYGLKAVVIVKIQKRALALTNEIMKTKTKYIMISFLLLLGARLLCAPGGVETDSTKSKYPLTDPRNPSCPCHKYQQEADKEYAQLMQRPGEQKLELEAKGNSFGDTKKVKHVRTFKWFFWPDKHRKNKTAKKKCFRDKLSRCFHF